MSGLVNSVVEISSFGLIEDVTGVEAAQRAANEAAGIQAGAQGQSQAMQAAYARIAQKNQALQDYSIRLSDAQMQAYKRERVKSALWFGLPLLAGVFVLIAVNMPKRKKRKGKKR